MMISPRWRVLAPLALGAMGIGLPAQAASGPSLPLKHAEPSALAAAPTRVRTLETSLGRTRRTEAGARERVEALDAQASALAGRLNELSVRERELAFQLQLASERLRKLAIASYVNGGSSASVDFLLRADNPVDLSRRRKLLTSVGRVRSQAVKDYTMARKAASDQLAHSIAELDRINAAGATARAELESATADAGRLTVQLDDARSRLTLLLAVTPVAASDIPGLFLDAYRAAASSMAKLRPGCGLRWTAVAGVGRIESNHGRWADSQLSLAGDISPPIIGIPLDGNNGTALVRDTDGGALDGDSLFDHAVGPMQVIPSTWQSVARDGNNDANASPNNIFDAALTAAYYLCRAAPNGLTADEDLQAAFFSYNHSVPYTEAALRWAKVYDGLRLPSGPIVSP